MRAELSLRPEIVLVSGPFLWLRGYEAPILAAGVGIPSALVLPTLG